MLAAAHMHYPGWTLHNSIGLPIKYSRLAKGESRQQIVFGQDLVVTTHHGIWLLFAVIGLSFKAFFLKEQKVCDDLNGHLALGRKPPSSFHYGRTIGWLLLRSFPFFSRSIFRNPMATLLVVELLGA